MNTTQTENKQKTPRMALNKAFLKLKPSRIEIDKFKKHLCALLDNSKAGESEEFHKNLIADFLKNTYYAPRHFINTSDRNDLVIRNGDTVKSKVGVIIEAKSPTNKAEMPTCKNLNSKALQELVLYYLRERITNQNIEIKQLIITNTKDWFVFDAREFDRFFAQDKALLKDFQSFNDKTLVDSTTDFFYKKIASPAIEKIKKEIEFTYFSLQEFEAALRSDNLSDDKALIPLYKVFSPEHLLKLPFVNDSNTLDQGFYHELLHIVGLTEVKEGGKKLIQRKEENERLAGSLLEDAITEFDSADKYHGLKNKEQYGKTKAERLFNIGLELSITWINRILFLKLLEAQLMSYHKGDAAYSFLNLDNIKNYGQLNRLFFQVLARQPQDRIAEVQAQFAHVPYLNSSLFEMTELERDAISISNLNGDKTLPILTSTVLKDRQGKKRKGKLEALAYLFEFLNAYDFASDGTEEVQEENKSLINASVLGLIFEKINGYQDGSFFTPGFITMYMSRETLHKAVIQKFNESKQWDCTSLDEVSDKLGTDKAARDEANAIINSLKICDPAVGSGHFLVSALNELIAVKQQLGILQDKEGRRLKHCQIEVVNDELLITDEDDELYNYAPKNKESQRIQETLFHEKQTIIENCLFGVDINPNSVKICRLRLWIELLKNAYYKTPTELETLPNIDINIKCGNSLVSRFGINADIKPALKKSKLSIEGYRQAVAQYRNARNKEEKRELEDLIAKVKSDFQTEISKEHPIQKRLNNAQGDLKRLQYGQLFERSKKEQAEHDKKVQTLAAEIQFLEAQLEAILSNKIYIRAFEWRFEFPEVLNDEGDFIGFDVIIGNPPYIKEYDGKETFDGLREKEIYQGKMDIWYLFVADGLNLLKENGWLNYIATNNWVTNSGASKLRNFILNQAKIETLIDFGSFMVFDSASIQTMILSLKKEKVDDYTFSFSKLNEKKPIMDDALELLSKTESSKNIFLNPTISKEKLLGQNLTFNLDNLEVVLEKIVKESSFKLTEDDVAQGIVFPQDFINEKSKYILGFNFDIGSGIFGLSDKEKNYLKLNENELKIIKPYFNSKQFFRYYANPKNEFWLIYTGSKFKHEKEILPYPNIKNHLDRFQSVITSDNKPYGLHRARVEDFFIGEKIIVQRKCPNKPVFSYTNFDTYVSATFYVIKTSRVNQKYLTGLLNARLIEFWLKHKGKMQGNNFQIDKEPLLNLPLIKPTKQIQTKIALLVDKIIKKKTADTNANTSELERQIDVLVYELYGLTEAEIALIEAS